MRSRCRPQGPHCFDAGAASSAVTLATPFAYVDAAAGGDGSVVAAVIDVDDVTVVVSVCTATLSAALAQRR